MSAVAVAVPPQRAIRTLRGALSAVAIALTVAAAGVLVACVVAGATPLVVVSGSMAPAINVGDLIVVRSTPIEAVEPGDVVTFRDSDRDGDLVTHRVVSVTLAASGREVVTRGDRNTAVERWSVEAHGEVGRFVVRVPRLGYVAGAAANPAVVLFAFLAAVAVAALRLIWRG